MQRICQIFFPVAALIGLEVASASAQSPNDLSPMTDLIDRHLADGESKPTIETCDDATFLRRASLDLIGRIPTIGERTRFLRNPDRELLVKYLIEREEHAEFWSQLWTTLLVGRSAVRGTDRELFRIWMEEKLRADTPMDSIAFDIISASGTSTLDGPVNYVVANRDDQVLRLGRAFLGIQLDCAKCHDHPFDRWTNDDYRSLQQFFRPLQIRQVAGGVLAEDVGTTNSDQDKPKFLTGRQPATAAWRRELALMVVNCKPFSRAVVNRVWSWTMGRGLCDPVDAISRDKIPDDFKLLDGLAREFREGEFSHSDLLKAICLSQSYSQITQTSGESNGSEFSCRVVRRLLPEQWIASVRTASGQSRLSPREVSQLTERLIGSRDRTLSGDPFDWTPNSQSMLRELGGQQPQLAAKVERMFLATLCREPTADEKKLLQSRSPDEVLFALIHANEFMTNQ